MLRKLPALTLLYVFLCATAFAQVKTGIIKGRLLNAATKAGFNDLRVTIPDLNVFTTSDGDGNFRFSEAPFGRQRLVVSSAAAKTDTIYAEVNKRLVDLGDIMVQPGDHIAATENNEIPTIAIDDNNANGQEDDQTSGGGGGGIFSSASDPFTFAASRLNFFYRFRPRGQLSNSNSEVQINGASINDLERDSWTWAQFGGLNDVLHSRNVTYGLRPSEYAYGGLIGTTYLDATAADQRKGTTASFTQTNTNYRSRIMLTHNTGLMKNGWAFSVSASRRWANEGYVPGTFYDGYSYYAAVSKVIKKSQFNITAIGSPTKRGASSFSSMDEAYNLANDHQYNSLWGYQNGKKRDSKVVNYFQPLFIANYTYKPSDRTRWNTALSYQFGKYKTSELDFYNAYNPFPDYYRNLPSYYLNLNPPNYAASAAVRAQYLAHPDLMQINWDELYNSNYINHETIYNVNGIQGNNVTGRRSLYVIANKVDDQKKLAFNTNIEHAVNEHLNVYGGINATSQQDENYKELADLLGGDFYVNYNQFATQTAVPNVNYNQNNMNMPNQLVRAGDKYGYDYIIHILQGAAWGQAAWSYNKVDFFVTAEDGFTSFQREGLMRNGLFPDNSYGTSAKHSFNTYRVKGGITYKIDLRNALYINADYSTNAPLVANTYISVNTRDFVVNNPTVSRTKTVEAGYLLKSPVFNARITGYVSDATDLTQITRFYNDDPSSLTFVNYVMNDVGIRSIGTEISTMLKVNKEWSVTGIAAIGQYYYTNRPTVTVYSDNSNVATGSQHTVYIKNFYAGTGPQSVYSLGLHYRPRGYWHFATNFNYLDRNYVAINPDLRTVAAVNLVTPNSRQWNDITSQDRLPSAYTVDLSGGKSFDISRMYKKLHHKTTLAINFGITNLLNNKNIKIAGYEQLRYDYTYSNPSKYAPKYDYAYGITYFVNLVLSF